MGPIAALQADAHSSIIGHRAQRWGGGHAMSLSTGKNLKRKEKLVVRNVS
jgi:hypothetical protein